MSYAIPVHSTKSTPDGVYAEALSKSFGEVQALREATFHAPAGSVLGLLGHNGAGKTTAVPHPHHTRAADVRPCVRRRLRSGRVAGGEVRARIGLTGQSATVDGLLSARANLELVGRLYHMPRAVVRKRAGELLAQLRPRGGGRPPRAHVLRRHAPPPRPRGEPRRESAGAVPRRAHDRPRSAEPQRPLGAPQRARGRGHDARAHDAVPRGGRPLRRPDRAARPRPGDRLRDARRAQGARRRRAPRRHAWPMPASSEPTAATLAAFGEDRPAEDARGRVRSRSPRARARA